MNHQHTLQLLHSLRLTGMADALLSNWINPPPTRSWASSSASAYWSIVSLLAETTVKLSAY
jgi:hypothetical protein